MHMCLHSFATATCLPKDAKERTLLWTQKYENRDSCNSRLCERKGAECVVLQILLLLTPFRYVQRFWYKNFTGGSCHFLTSWCMSEFHSLQLLHSSSTYWVRGVVTCAATVISWYDGRLKEDWNIRLYDVWRKKLIIFSSNAFFFVHTLRTE